MCSWPNTKHAKVFVLPEIKTDLSRQEYLKKLLVNSLSQITVKLFLNLSDFTVLVHFWTVSLTEFDHYSGEWIENTVDGTIRHGDIYKNYTMVWAAGKFVICKHCWRCLCTKC